MLARPQAPTSPEPTAARTASSRCCGKTQRPLHLPLKVTCQSTFHPLTHVPRLPPVKSNAGGSSTRYTYGVPYREGRTHPFNTGYLPLKYSSNPGVNVPYREGRVWRDRVYNQTARHVNQGGGKRMGSFAMCTSPRLAQFDRQIVGTLVCSRGEESLPCSVVATLALTGTGHGACRHRAVARGRFRFPR